MAWPYKQVTKVVITSISGAITLLITSYNWYRSTLKGIFTYIWLKLVANVRNFPCIDGIHEDHEIRLGKLNTCMLEPKNNTF